MVPLSDRSLRNLILKLECFGFLTPNVRREYPNWLPVYGAEVLENTLYELAVPPDFISVAKNRYEWEFKALVSDLATGHFFFLLNCSDEVLDLSQAKRYGQTILTALEVVVTRLSNANRWITKLDDWPEPSFDQVSRVEALEQRHSQMRDLPEFDSHNIERMTMVGEQVVS